MNTPHGSKIFETGSSSVEMLSSQQVGGGRFVLQKIIGRGGMGIVWLAHDERLAEPVALKFLPPQIRSDAAALDDLRRETMRSRKLSHPNIIRIHDLFEAPGEDPFISMEYVDGPNLTALRIEQPNRLLSWEFLKPLVKQLCDALHYAHSEKIIHRDLKPANLMIDSKGRLKLADFGIARIVSDSMSRVSVNNNTSGTLVYMSPQQMDGEVPRVTDDLYAMGATLYELLTSKPPFYSGDIVHQVRNVPPKPMNQRLADLELSNEIPLNVAAVIAACLDKDAGRRPQTALEAADRLGLLDYKLDLYQTPSTGDLPLKRKLVSGWRAATATRRRKFISGAVALFVLLSLAGAWYMLFTRPARLDQMEARRWSTSRGEVPPGKRGDNPTAFDLVKLGNPFLKRAASRDKVVQIISGKTDGATIPTSWRVIYYDPDVNFKAAQIRFERGEIIGPVTYPVRLFEAASKTAQQPLDGDKLKTDSDKAFEIALKELGSEAGNVKQMEMKLEHGSDGLPVWRVTFWAARRPGTNFPVKMGEVTISAEDGRVLKNGLTATRSE